MINLHLISTGNGTQGLYVLSIMTSFTIKSTEMSTTEYLLYNTLFKVLYRTAVHYCAGYEFKLRVTENVISVQ